MREYPGRKGRAGSPPAFLKTLEGRHSFCSESAPTLPDMPETTERKRYRRGPAPGHLWSGVYDPSAPVVEPDTPPAPPRRPETPDESLDNTPHERAPRRTSSGRRALAAGLVTGALVTGGVLGAVGLFGGDDDGNKTPT